MKKVIAASIVVLFVGAGAFGQIGNIGPQTQAWDIGLRSSIGLLSGQGTATNLQTVSIMNGQKAETSDGVHAFQGFRAGMTQNSLVTNVGAQIGVTQGTLINGDHLVGTGGTVLPLGQTQALSTYGGPAMQYEGVEVAATQDLTKVANGTGTAEGQNTTQMGMIQCGGSTCYDMGQLTKIEGEQVSTLTGDTCASSGVVSTSFRAVVVQQQAVNCAVAPCPAPPVEP